MDEWVNSRDSGKSKRLKTPSFEQIDQKLYEFMVYQRSVKKFTNFRSNFTNRSYEIGRKNECQRFQGFGYGESNDVNQETVEKWKRKISRLIAGYEAKDLYNADQTCLFFKGILTESLVLKSESSSGGKKAKDRLTVLMCGSTAGEIRKPLVIGKSKKPRCFKSMDISSLPVCHVYEYSALDKGLTHRMNYRGLGQSTDILSTDQTDNQKY
ncbi:DDE superfamily endonuclease domain [Cinara cedri]|uniref:DDE superfamily endonuclease domain n=1 Tax=Cinara cedri TaxID=506608 RepID=A0A5E4M4W7_9HEMI|nr:DDE superfamily endonuclease domain [Cinara cedri]